MKSPVALTFGLLTLPALIAAQNPQPAQAPGSQPIATFNGATIHTSSCPIAMQAKQGSGSGLVMVKRERPQDGGSQDGESLLDTKPSQRIHLILGKMPGAHFSDPHLIAAATVTVKGLSARGRLDLTLDSSGGNGPSDLRRTLNVTFNIENDGAVSADLNLPGFTSVNSITLESVSLKDGSKWKLADLKTCSVTPDRMMLIAAQ